MVFLNPKLLVYIMFGIDKNILHMLNDIFEWAYPMFIVALTLAF